MSTQPTPGAMRAAISLMNVYCHKSLSMGIDITGNIDSTAHMIDACSGAPEMAKALQEALEKSYELDNHGHVDCPAEPNDRDSVCTCWKSKARAALAKFRQE